uniref:hypothetical protein n=1 Tax=Streptosporangium sp. CA-235898 TaxID=3240073 RepID=UPI003F49AE44
MGKARITPGLTARLAAGPVRRKVERITAAAAAETRDRAPDAKTWTTAPDGRARPSHAHADGQTVAENVSYKLPKAATAPDGTPVIAPGYDYASRPRDPRLPRQQSDGCRCHSIPLPGELARATRITPVVVTPGRVSASVVCEYHRVVEAEFGSSQDAGAHFMGQAAQVVAARYRT